MDVRDISIISQVAAKIASELTAAEIRAAGGEELSSTYLADKFDAWFSHAKGKIVGEVEEFAASLVQQAFPGTERASVDSSSTSAPIPPSGGPAPVPGSVNPEALWQEYFADTSKWWDNRNDKRNPASPDFKRKVARGASDEEKRNAPGLWVKHDSTPAWVKAALGVAA